MVFLNPFTPTSRNHILPTFREMYFQFTFLSCGRLIKMSSPRLNNITVVGCIFIYLSVILYGVDGKFLDEKGYTAVCQVVVVCVSFVTLLRL